jgi:hypothetical protein
MRCESVCKDGGDGLWIQGTMGTLMKQSRVVSGVMCGILCVLCEGR